MVVPPPPLSPFSSRHCPRVRARAMAAFDYLIDSEYSGPGAPRGGGGGGRDLSLFNFLQIFAFDGGGGGPSFSGSTCRSCVFVCVTYEGAPTLEGKGTSATTRRTQGNGG